MVNLLETLYVVTAISMIGAIIASLRGAAVPARLLLMATVVSALAALALYVYLSP